MSWNNVVLAWVFSGDNIIREYLKGNITLKEAEERLDYLGVPESMKQRLYKEEKE